MCRYAYRLTTTRICIDPRTDSPGSRSQGERRGRAKSGTTAQLKLWVTCKIDTASLPSVDDPLRPQSVKGSSQYAAASVRPVVKEKIHAGCEGIYDSDVGCAQHETSFANAVIRSVQNNRLPDKRKQRDRASDYQYDTDCTAAEERPLTEKKTVPSRW